MSHIQARSFINGFAAAVGVSVAVIALSSGWTGSNEKTVIEITCPANPDPKSHGTDEDPKK